MPSCSPASLARSLGHQLVVPQNSESGQYFFDQYRNVLAPSPRTGSTTFVPHSVVRQRNNPQLRRGFDAPQDAGRIGLADRLGQGAGLESLGRNAANDIAQNVIGEQHHKFVEASKLAKGTRFIVVVPVGKLRRARWRNIQ